MSAPVGLAHHHVEALTPSAVALAELTVLQPLGVLGLVLVPQQREGDVLVAAFGVDLSPVRMARSTRGDTCAMGNSRASSARSSSFSGRGQDNPAVWARRM